MGVNLAACLFAHVAAQGDAAFGCALCCVGAAHGDIVWVNRFCEVFGYGAVWVGAGFSPVHGDAKIGAACATS